MARGAPSTSVFVLLIFSASIFLCLSHYLIWFVWMHVCRPHGNHEGIRFGNFKVWSQCVSFPCAPCFCAILVLALQFGYHQAPREGSFAIFPGISSDLF
uniref:Putative ovule protein n=1 Tax=Solanum chacoense TaxID=4108 RepID=A0A0V0GHQ6_SOLCH